MKISRGKGRSQPLENKSAKTGKNHQEIARQIKETVGKDSNFKIFHM